MFPCRPTSQQSRALIFGRDNKRIQVRRFPREAVALSHHESARAIQPRLFFRVLIEFFQERLPWLGYFPRVLHEEGLPLLSPSVDSNVLRLAAGFDAANSSLPLSANHGIRVSSFTSRDRSRTSAHSLNFRVRGSSDKPSANCWASVVTNPSRFCRSVSLAFCTSQSQSNSD